ncbi:MAG: multidrug efflux RND transporter permease subunit [Sedimentisphaerales bacterium]|nr:multidrug efflux RND transporter permease subunit [Sedimentisphaerales bacterium]
MISEFFINRPVFASVISIVIVLIGLITIPLLPVEKTPDITPPTVVVEATYPGANAEVVAETVATPIEQAINGVDDMLYISSSCSDSGRMSVTVTFEVGTDIDMATVLVQNRVATVEAKLPEEVKRLGVTTQKQSSNITLVASLISTDGRYDDIYMSNYVNLRMKDELLRVPGVGNIMVFGSKDFAMRLWLDPEKLKARSMTTGDVLAAVREQNIEVAAGQIGSTPTPDNQKFQYTIKTLGRLSTVEEFEDIVLKAAPNGQILRLKDVARVELGAEGYFWSVQLNDKPSVAMGIFQRPGANSLEVATGIAAKLKELSKSFPEGLEYHIPYNPTTFVSESIHEVLITLAFTVFLVIFSVYIFLEDWRATLIPSITIPVSLIGTFAVMLALGMSINTLTMFGLVLVIGVVVDDAIVVVENVSRIIEHDNLSARDASIKAMKQITAPILATTLVLLAVFVPTVIMGGISGMLYMQFGITIAIAVCFSTINALTLSPALTALLLRPRSEHGNRLAKWFDRFMKSSTSSYVEVVRSVIRKSIFAMLIFAIMTAGSLIILKKLPTGFIPNEDEGSIFVNVRLPDGSTLDRTRQVLDQVGQILQTTPGVQDYVSVAGFSMLDNAIAPNGGICFVNLAPWAERKDPALHVSSIISTLQMRLFGITDGFCLAFGPPSIRGLGNTGGFELRLQDRGGAGLQALEKAANDLLAQASASPVMTRLNSTFRASVPQLYVDIDRVKAKSLGVPLSTVFDTLQTYLGSTYVNDFNLFGRTFKVVAQADREFRATADSIGQLEVRNAQGQMLPLRTLLMVQDTVGPQLVTHYNLYSSTTITGEVNPGFSSGQAIAEMERLCKEILPSNIGYEWSGMSYQEIRAGNQAPIIFMVAALFSFLFLAAQYESWMIPLAIVFAVPLALLGAVSFTWLRAYDNNIYTQIGIVLLIGLATKTAILLVEFAKTYHEEGHGIEEAAITAARLRFRPILMTALSTLIGTVPLVIATGAGAVARRALGTAVFGGMLLATIFGVLMVPVFYVVVQKLTEMIRPKKTEKV